MRELPHCRSFVTDSYASAHMALAEATAFLLLHEGPRAPFGCTVISVDLAMDDQAMYYANVVIEDA